MLLESNAQRSSLHGSFLATPLPHSNFKGGHPPCTKCCCGAFKCLWSIFQETPSTKYFVSSHLLSQGWLTIFRVVAFIYLFIVGFLLEWGLGKEGWHFTWYSTPARLVRAQ